MNALTYQTQTNSIKIDGVKNLFIRSLLDRQQYYDPTGAAARLFVDECANPNAEVWIVDPNRGYRTAFNKKMGLLGFQLSSEASLSEVEITDEKYKGRLLIYNRC